MIGSEIVKAVRYLRPNADFSFTDDDYSTVVWNSLDGSAPTYEELEQALEELRAIEAQAEAEAEAKREAALSKRAALGLTADDLKALGL